ncbi:IPExxxVDY family protein [Maribacter sp. 2210JD10-5]|uniref:IPExxxVDY family protein n=1 Tax=Maribacter sp. 2210JD10-5 TaxID=3386272 RepID=UPI0039BD1353
MGAVYKINDDFYDDSFLLIALHSTLEDYAIVYQLNLNLNAKFKRVRSDLDLGKTRTFPLFEWQDDYNDRYLMLVSNQSTEQEFLPNNDLFQNEPTATTPKLVPELKDVDYFLKIEEGEAFQNKEILRKVTSMPKIMAAYEVEANKLKSKNNLIF